MHEFKILIDMNLSPSWVPILEKCGWSAVHWSTVGDSRATDETIMNWALGNSCIIFTHDLDFGTMLALTYKNGPSVLQVRGMDVLPDYMAKFVIAALYQHEADLVSGCLLVVDDVRCRVRMLPI